MIRALAVATLVVAATASVASAETYVSLGIGSTGVSDAAQNGFTENGRSGRVTVGYRFAIPQLPPKLSLSVEGGGSRFGAAHGSADYDGTDLFAAGKVSFGMGTGFEVFGRLGLQHLSLSTDTNQPGLSGSGSLLSAGFEYRIPQKALKSASIWVDLTRASSNMTADAGTAKPRDIAFNAATLGISVGF